MIHVKMIQKFRRLVCIANESVSKSMALLLFLLTYGLFQNRPKFFKRKNLFHAPSIIVIHVVQ